MTFTEMIAEARENPGREYRADGAYDIMLWSGGLLAWDGGTPVCLSGYVLDADYTRVPETREEMSRRHKSELSAALSKKSGACVCYELGKRHARERDEACEMVTLYEWEYATGEREYSSWSHRTVGRHAVPPRCARTVRARIVEEVES